MAKHKMERIHPKQTVAKAFETILRTNLDTVSGWEKAALKGKDIEGVHQMRVGLRRMRSALTVFKSSIPRKYTKPLDKEMRWAANRLGYARDMDVYIHDNFIGKRTKDSIPAGKKRLHKIALKDRETAYDQVRGFIHGSRYVHFKEDLSSWLDHNGWEKNLPKKKRAVLKRAVKPFAIKELESRLKQVLSDGRKIKTLDEKALHQLRIDCKKLRYATEFFEQLFGKKMFRFVEQLKELQELLGTLNDGTVMKKLQKELLTGKKDPKATQYAGKLLGQRIHNAKVVRKTLMGSWNEFRHTPQPW